MWKQRTQRASKEKEVKTGEEKPKVTVLEQAIHNSVPMGMNEALPEAQPKNEENILPENEENIRLENEENIPQVNVPSPQPEMIVDIRPQENQAKKGKVTYPKTGENILIKENEDWIKAQE